MTEKKDRLRMALDLVDSPYPGFGPIGNLLVLREAVASIAIDADGPGQTCMECERCGRGMATGSPCPDCGWPDDKEDV